MPQPDLYNLVVAAKVPAVRRPSLPELERVIENGLRSFYEAGSALTTIRDGRLYEGQYPSFEAYCKERWGFSRIQAHRLIQAAKVAWELWETLPMGNALPATERHVRELARAPEGERAEVWQKVVSSPEPVTAARVREVVEERLPQRQAPDLAETFRGMLTSAVSYGIVVAELDPDAVRRMFEEALRDALRDLKEMA